MTDARADARISNAVLSVIKCTHSGSNRRTSTCLGQRKSQDGLQIEVYNPDTLTEGSKFTILMQEQESISLGPAGAQAYNNSTGVLTIPTTDLLQKVQCFIQMQKQMHVLLRKYYAHDVNTSGMLGQVDVQWFKFCSTITSNWCNRSC